MVWVQRDRKAHPAPTPCLLLGLPCPKQLPCGKPGLLPLLRVLGQDRDGRFWSRCWTWLGWIGVLQSDKERSRVVSVRDPLLLLSTRTKRGERFDHGNQFKSWGWSSLLPCVPSQSRECIYKHKQDFDYCALSIIIVIVCAVGIWATWASEALNL